jgi:hypothetical protein
MSNTYVLVNPFIHGEFEHTVKAKNSVEAGKIFYKGLSEHFNNAVPKFYFTIQKGDSGNGKYSHFKVVEKKNKNDIDFSLQSYEIKGGEDMDTFKNKLENFKNKFAQYGGKKKSKKSKKSKKYDSDSDDDSDDEYKYKRINSYILSYDQPIYYWWYDPSIYRLSSYYIPTFYSYVTPLIEISLF